jgi:diketogulonate reductase-like aldo/keto reductase
MDGNGYSNGQGGGTLGRRAFVQRLALATAGGGFVASAFAGYTLTKSQKAEAAEAINDKVGKLPKRRLGTRMGNMEVTPIIYCQDNVGELLGPCLAAGMNFIHKAGYWHSLPEELKKLPRESYYTDITVDSTPNNPDDEDYAYHQVTKSLKENGLKYYDVFRAHYGWKSVQAMKQLRGTHRAFDRLKKEGKVKYFGASQHSGGGFPGYPEIIQAQIDEGLIASIQAFLHYDTPPETWEVFERAHKAGIGITAMKTVAHGGGRMRRDEARMAELKAPGMLGRACLRHVLSKTGSDGKRIVDCAVSALRNFNYFEENVGAAAPKVALADGFSLAV